MLSRHYEIYVVNFTTKTQQDIHCFKDLFFLWILQF